MSGHEGARVGRKAVGTFPEEGTTHIKAGCREQKSITSRAVESFVQLFTHSSSSAYFLSACCIPGSVLDIRTPPKQHRVTPCLHGAYIPMGEEQQTDLSNIQNARWRKCYRGTVKGKTGTGRPGGRGLPSLLTSSKPTLLTPRDPSCTC